MKGRAKAVNMRSHARGATDRRATCLRDCESQMVHHAGIEQCAQGVRQHDVALGDELVTQAAVARVEVDEPVRDHLSFSFSFSFFAKTTRWRGLSSLEVSTSRGTFSTTFHGRTSLPVVLHLRRDASWILQRGQRDQANPGGLPRALGAGP